MVPSSVVRRLVASAGPTFALLPAVCSLGAQETPAVDPRPVLEIGILEGDDAYVFGRIRDLAVAADGTLFVIDEQAARVSAFAADGRFLGSAGRHGNGPGEFVHPAAVALRGDTVHVLDDGQYRVNRYAWSVEGVRPAGEIGLPFLVKNMCILRDRIVGFAYHEGHMVHVFDLRGEHRSSFGAPFIDDPVLARGTNGWIACMDGERPAIAVAAVNHPDVRVYDLSGALRWEARLEDFHASTITRVGQEGRRIGLTLGGGNPDVVLSVGALDGQLLVQWATISREVGIWDITRPRTTVFDLETGRRLGLTESLPRVDAAQGDRIWSTRIHPFPRILAYTVRRR